jgi:hypothetical protein
MKKIVSKSKLNPVFEDVFGRFGIIFNSEEVKQDLSKAFKQADTSKVIDKLIK